MALLIEAADRHNARSLLNSSFALRKKVLVDKLRWELPSGSSPLETDQFDDGDTCHLISLNRDGSVRGTLRAALSLSPNLTCDVLQSYYPAPIPRGPNIGEISRLCVDLDLSPIERQAARADLFVSLAELCLERGWEQIVGILRQGLLFEFVRVGLIIDMLSPPIKIGPGTDPAAAFLMQTAQSDVDRCRKVFGIRSVLQAYGPANPARFGSAA